MKYYKAVIIEQTDDEGMVTAVRESASCFKNEDAAKQKYGFRFLYLASGPLDVPDRYVKERIESYG